MSRYQPYTSYKDSGVEWLGEIPEHWETSKIKSLCYINDGNHGEEYPTANDYTDENDGVPFIRAGNINDLSISSQDMLYITKDKNKSMRKGRLQVNDILFTNRGQIGKIAVIPIEFEGANLNSQIAYLRADTSIVVNKFLAYFLTSDVVFCFYDSMSAGSVLTQFPIRDLRNIPVTLPMKAEQTAIANFLDIQTAKIDTLIAKQQRMIELLGEKRSALISHAVTKGIDPDVPMKDSGVEWLGEVPKHWGIGLLSSLFSDNKEKNAGLKNSNLLSLSYGNIIQKDIDTLMGLLPESFDSYQIVHPGYIILRLTDLQNDKKSLRTGFVRETGIITSAYVGLAKKSQSIGNEKYFHLYLYTFDVRKGFYGMGAGVRQGLNFDELKKLKFTLPPYEEQNSIVEFIEKETAKIDTLIAKARQAIELMKERRTALISAAVTGKIDVRGE